MPMTPAPTTVRLRGTCGSEAISSLSKTLRPLKGDVGGAMRRGADRQHDLVAGDGNLLVAGGNDKRMRIGEAGETGESLDAVAGELVLEHLDLVVERLAKADAKVLALDILLHPIGEAVKGAL